jgi:hypothetical protein
MAGLLAALVLIVACAGNQPSPFSLDGGEEAALYQENFAPAQTGNWVLEGDEAARTLMQGEQLLIQVDAPGVIQFATLASPTFSDLALEVDARRTAGAAESTYGVLWRMQDETRFYRFAVTGNGLFMVERHDGDGRWTQLLDGWQESTAINTALNDVNRLRVKANGELISVYVNDTLLAQVSDDAYGEGTIALSAGTFGQPGLAVAFDNVRITTP